MRNIKFTVFGIRWYWLQIDDISKASLSVWGILIKIYSNSEDSVRWATMSLEEHDRLQFLYVWTDVSSHIQVIGGYHICVSTENGPFKRSYSRTTQTLTVKLENCAVAWGCSYFQTHVLWFFAFPDTWYASSSEKMIFHRNYLSSSCLPGAFTSYSWHVTLSGVI
jgi:hypothetical protein